MRTGPDRSKAAFERLYDRVAERLLVHLVRRMQDIDGARELWCECWAVAFAGWARCKARSLAQEEAWVFGIARRQLAGYYRSGAIRRRALERLRWTVPTVEAAEYEQLTRLAELDDLRRALDNALARLPEKRRAALRLRIVSGLPYEEVAQRIGCSEQVARAHVSRGLRRLAEVLDQNQMLVIQGGDR